MNLKVAVAQVSSVAGNVEKNITTHIIAIKRANDLNVSYIVFPELSLTGYEPTLAGDLAFVVNDKRLQPLIDCAIKNEIQIGVGAPVKSDGLPKIGLFIINKLGAVKVYEKMYLHPGEEIYFSDGDEYQLTTLENTNIANAICADTNKEAHVKKCIDLGASVYIAGVLISEAGYESDTHLMKGYASKYHVLVAMANHNKPTGNWSPIGKSAIWSNSGLLACANETQNALIVAQKSQHGWSAKVYDF